MADDKKLTKRSEDLSDWYNERVVLAELADYSPLRRGVVIRPPGHGPVARLPQQPPPTS